LPTNISALTHANDNLIVWLKDIQNELGWDSLENTYSATKAVLQAVRDRLPVEEVIHLSASLPLIMKGMLIDQYDYTVKPAKIWTQSLFLELVEEYYNPYKRNTIHPEEVVQAVIAVLNRRMGGGEMSKVAAIMPQEIKLLFQQAGVEVTEVKNMPSGAV
jgi:uncharacterized protein (DUF2267 family)